MDGQRLVAELAGITGLDPGPLTLRDLNWMAEARQREAWGRTSTLLALIANVARAMGGKAGSKTSGGFKPADFDPFEQRRQAHAEPLPGNIRMLKDVFIRTKGL